MEEEPVRHWRRLLRDGAADAAARALRDYHASHGDALCVLWRAWTRRRSPSPTAEDHADARVLLLAAAAIDGARTALASELLRRSAEDAARDLLAFAQAAEAWGETPSALLHAAMNNLWTQLIRTATAILVSNEAAADYKKTKQVNSQEEVDADAMSWDEFVALPCALDKSALHNSVHGRVLAQHMDEMVALQQWHWTHAGEQESSSDVLSVRDALKEAVRRLESCVTLQTTTEEPKINGADDSYRECEDASSIHSYLRGDVARFGCESSRLATCDVSSTDGGPTLVEIDESGWNEDAVEAIFEEVHAIHEILPLSIRVAAVLGKQLKTCAKLASFINDTTARDWEQRIRKEVNSLTHDSQSETTSPQLLQLLRYAALAPVEVLDVIVDSVVTTGHHHVFFAQLFAWCPLLLHWREASDPSAPSRLLTAFAEVLTRVVNASDKLETPVEDCSGVRFMLEVSARTGILEPNVVVENVFWRVLDGLSTASRPLTRLFDLLHRFFVELRDRKRRCSLELLAKTFAVVGEHYRRICTTDYGSSTETTRVVEFRDIALLLTREIVVASQPEMLEDWTCDIPSQTLLEVHGIRPSQPVEEEPLVPSDSCIITTALEVSIQRWLWSLVWANEDLKDHTEFSNPLVRILTGEFVDPSGRLRVTGANLVQIEIANMLFTSGRRTFDRIVHVVEVVLLPMVRGLDRSGGQSTVDEPVSQELMAYVVRCWCIGAFGSDEPKVDSVLRMLEHSIRTYDRAIEAVTDDPFKLLRCLQVIGLLNSWLCAHAAVSQARALQQRVVMTAVRVLFLLTQLPPDKLLPPHDESSFRQSVAAALFEGQLLEEETVIRFLQTTVQRG